MPVEVIMPKVDMDMDHGRISAWHVAEGETVEAGAPVFEIETDKAAMEVEAPASGILRSVTAAAGADVAIGTAVAWIYAADEAADPPPAAPAGEASSPPSPAGSPVGAGAARPAPEAPPAPAGPSAGSRLRATPAARALAARHGVTLTGMSGSGPRQRIQRADVAAIVDSIGPPDQAPAPPARPADQPGALSVQRAGRGTGPALVMLHGFAADASTWTLLERELPHERRAARIELPGHGQSPLRRVESFAELAAEIRRAIDALDLEDVHLIGHSLGGALALAVADTRPRMVSALTLIAPAGLGPEIDADAIAGIARASKAESLGPWLQHMVGAPEALPWSFVQAAARSRADPEMRAVQQAMAESLFPDGVQAFDVSAALARLNCPARIIWGRRDRIIPWRHALRAPGGVALNLFDGLGHMPHVEAPGEVAALLRRHG